MDVTRFPHARRTARTAVLALLAATVTLAAASRLGAAEVKLFETASRDAFLAGTFDGISVAPLGALELAARLERVTAIEEPFVFAAAGHPDGWVVGTGNDGRVLLIESDGSSKVLFQAAEPEIFAVAAGDDGTVYAASSPDGKVYRYASGSEEAEVVFDPEERYIWTLEPAPDGSLLVATGLPGRLYRLGADGRAERLLDSGDAHVRAALPLADGAVLAGTAGQGLVLRRDREGGVRNLYDATHPEVLAFAAGDGGAIYVALLASEASLVDLSASNGGTGGAAGTGNGASDEKGEKDEGGSVSVGVAGGATVGSRGAGFGGPRSVLIRIDADGAVEELWAFEDETVHALAFSDGALWVGTGEEGKLYRWRDRRMVLEHRLDERQIVAAVPAAAGLTVATTNAGALYRLGATPAAQGTYTSAVLDAGQAARFGTFFWHGETPAGSAVELAFRSGMGAEPDATWTSWSPAARGRELPLGALAAGRYVQWRATMLREKDGAGPRLTRAELSYRQLNRRPAIASFEILDPGEVIVPANFNPQNQTFEPWSPTRDGIFTTLAPAGGNDDARTKTLWKKGYRTLRWSASDANEDTLRYDLAFLRGAAGSGADEGWLPMVADLEDSHYSFDATALPDGVYRFRLEASDREAQAHAGEALSAVEVSPPVVIDHTVPVFVPPARVAAGAAMEVEVRDALSPLRRAEWSADGGGWQPAVAVDGLLDGRAETLRLEVPESARLVLLRIMDAAFNVVTFDLSAARAP